MKLFRRWFPLSEPQEITGEEKGVSLFATHVFVACIVKTD
jgi:hypothetical protein